MEWLKVIERMKHSVPEVSAVGAVYCRLRAPQCRSVAFIRALRVSGVIGLVCECCDVVIFRSRLGLSGISQWILLDFLIILGLLVLPNGIRLLILVVDDGSDHSY